MNPNYVHTITLYHKIPVAEDKKEHWTKSVFHNCFWKSVVNTGFNGTQASVQNTYVTRIPKESCSKVLSVLQGDIVILGECQEEITGVSGQTAAQVLNRNKPNAFKVTAFSDNTSFPVDKHYRLGG